MTQYITSGNVCPKCGGGIADFRFVMENLSKTITLQCVNGHIFTPGESRVGVVIKESEDAANSSSPQESQAGR